MTEESTTDLAPPVELSEEQRLYEEMFGEQPEWHQPATATEATEDDDDAVYARLFGVHHPDTERTQP